MTRFKTALFLATVASGALLASAAQAQTAILAPALNDGETVLHGVGASSIQTVLVQQLNCIGATNNALGLIGGTTADTFDSSGNLVTKGNGLTRIAEPTDLPISSGGTFNCSSQSIEPNFSAKYVATGSGFGKTAWSSAGAAFATSGSNTNPFASITDALENPTPITWTSVQFAFSDSNLSSTELTNYDNNVKGTAGPAVFFPMYVLPVAVAYNPQYGTNALNTAMNFHVASKTVLGVAAGGLQLNASTYCKIFNGYIVNWNDQDITDDNGGTPLFDTMNDTASRWSTEGAPIRLIGRVDRSGTTDIFTRHLAEICSRTGVMASGQVNKFANNAETLPYSRGVAGTPDFSSVRSDTGLSASSSATRAGTVNSVSNTYFISTASGFGAVSGGTSGAPTQAGTGLVNGAGLFIVANGSGGVANAINFAPDFVAASGVKLNGKIGYIGADFVAPAPGATLFAAALKGSAGASSNSSDYKMPSAAEGTAAVGAVLPPQSDSTGAFVATDTSRGLRSDPLAWTGALYAGSSTLAAPTAGYPITGTTQFAGYTCYKAGNADAIANFVGWNMGQVTTDSNSNARAGIFSTSGSSVSGSGLLVRSNIGAMPPRWQTAITESFYTGDDGLDLQIRSVAAGGVCSGKTGR